MSADAPLPPLPAPPDSPSVEQLLAYCYDLEHDALVDDVEFYLGLAHQQAGPILELGCGTGRVLAPLVAADHRVIGVDAAPAMLARAEARLQASGGPGARWRLVTADARQLALPERFGLVLAPLDLLGYFPAVDDQLALLSAARRLLAAGGRLVLDVAFPEAFLDQPSGLLVHQWTHPTADGGTITKWWVRNLEIVQQLQQLTAFYDLVAADGGLRRLVEPLTLRYYHPVELEHLLARAGFLLQARFGDYGGEPLQAGSPRQLLIARAADAR